MKKKVLPLILSIFAIASCGGNYIKDEAREVDDYANDTSKEEEMAKEEANPDRESPNDIEDLDAYIEKFVYIDLEA